MAYAYTLNDTGGSSSGYVKYNISPDLTSSLGSGDMVTITGQIYNTKIAIKYIQAVVWDDPAASSTDNTTQVLSTISKSIKKSTKSTFTMTFTVTQAIIDALKNGGHETSGSYQYGYIQFIFSNGTSIDAGTIRRTNTSSSQRLKLIKQRTNPVITSITIGDNQKTPNKSNTLYSKFGGYIKGYSIPKFDVQYSIDSKDEKLTGVHTLTLGASGSSKTIVKTTNITNSGSGTLTYTLTNKELSSLLSYGTLTYSHSIVDSAGNRSATQTGSVTVYNYSDPTITTFHATRYKYVVDEGDVIADDGNKLMLSLAGRVSSVNNRNSWDLILSYEPDIDGAISTDITLTSGTDGSSFSYSNDKAIIQEEISVGNSYTIWAYITDSVTQIIEEITVLKSGAYFNIEKTGVAVGMRTTGTSDDKKFEVAEDYKTHLYGDVVIDGDVYINGDVMGAIWYTTQEVDTGNQWLHGQSIYRKTFVADVDKASNEVVIGTIADLDTVISINGIFKRSTGVFDAANYYRGTSNYSRVCVNNSNEIRGFSTYVGTYYVTIEYTKVPTGDNWDD